MHDGVGAVALNIGVLAAAAGHIHVPASPNLVRRRVLDLSRDDHVVAGCDGGDDGGRRNGEANRTADAPSLAIVARGNDTTRVRAAHVGELKIIPGANLNPVNPKGHIVVGDTANLKGGRGTLGPSSGGMDHPQRRGHEDN